MYPWTQESPKYLKSVIMFRGKMSDQYITANDYNIKCTSYIAMQLQQFQQVSVYVSERNSEKY